MFTPQQIDQISFSKSTFGGYNMQQVDEFLEPLRVPLDEAVRQCMDGTLTDAKTVAAILKGKILRES